MKRAILVGYYGKQNAGDDAFLNVTAWAARKFLDVDEIHALAPEVPVLHGAVVHSLNLPKQLKFNGFFKQLRLRRFLRNTQHVIFGGGSNFHTSKHLEEFSSIVEAAGAGPHLAVGVSLGPFRDAQAHDNCAALLSKLAFVGLRDKSSYERAQAMNLRNTRVELTFDLAPLLAQATDFTPSPVKTEGRTLAVSLCNYERFTQGDLQWEARRIELMAEALRQSLEKGLCEKILLVDMNSHPKYGDRMVHARLKELIGLDPQVSEVPYSGDAAAVMRALGGANAVLAMRLHAAVFAFALGIPTGLVAYHEKCFAWAEMAGIPKALVNSAFQMEQQQLFATIEELMENPAGSMPLLSVDRAIKDAQRNWSWLG